MIEINQVSFGYGARKSKFFNNLRDVSFKVLDGECFGVIGLNGAGKSTLLKVLGGVFEPDNGSVRSNRPLSTVYELGACLLSDFDLADNVRFAVDSNPDQYLGFDATLSFVKEFSGLDVGNMPVRNYSSGMAAKLAFSLAVSNPSCNFLIDEVLSVGDLIFQGRSFDRLKWLKERGASIVVISHDLRSLESLADKILILDGGTVAFCGSVREGVYRYLDMIKGLTISAHRASLEFGHLDASSVSVNCNLLDDSLDESAQFIPGGQIVLEVLITGLEFPSEDLTVGFGLHNQYGMKMFGTNTKLLDSSVQVGSDGHVRVLFEIENYLGVGDYRVSVSVHKGLSHIDQCIALVSEACSFSVRSDGISSEGFSSLPVRVRG